MIIEVSSSYFADWVESHYLSLIQRVIKEETQLSPHISFAVVQEDYRAGHRPTTEPATDSLPVTLLPTDSSQEPVASDSPEQETLPSAGWLSNPLFITLNQRYTFETFVIGEGNRLTHAAALAVSKSPGKTQFNPLVIYGGVGLGKTHLLQAIGHYALSHKTAQRVVYVPSEKFMSDFIQAIRTRNTADFQRLYRNADILLVDDIQFLLKGEHTQNEFFHTFNALHQNGKQIAMTCDSPPGELKGLEERLISRFQWGLVTSIEPPDLETRIAILHQKAEINGIHLPEEVAAFLGTYFSSNIRELEGALNHLMAYCAVNQVELNIEGARKIVQERIPVQGSQLAIEIIQQIVAEHFGLTPELLIGKTRKQEVAVARQVAMLLVKRLTQTPLKVIGLNFGNRDHSTVIHAVQTIEKKCQSDPALEQLIKSLSEAIQRKSSE